MADLIGRFWKDHAVCLQQLQNMDQYIIKIPFPIVSKISFHGIIMKKIKCLVA